MSRIRRHWTRAASREAARLDRIAETLPSIPVLQPITTRARQLDPGLWPSLSEDRA